MLKVFYGSGVIVFLYLVDCYKLGFIMVNLDGWCFVNESLFYYDVGVVMIKICCGLGWIEVWLIVDYCIICKYGIGFVKFYFMLLVLYLCSGYLMCGKMLVELVDRIGVFV